MKNNKIKIAIFTTLGFFLVSPLAFSNAPDLKKHNALAEHDSITKTTSKTPRLNVQKNNIPSLNKNTTPSPVKKTIFPLSNKNGVNVESTGDKKAIKNIDNYSIKMKEINMELELNKAKLELHESRKKLSEISGSSGKIIHNDKVGESLIQRIKLNLIYADKSSYKATITIDKKTSDVGRDSKIENSDIIIDKITKDSIFLIDEKTKKTRNITLSNNMELI